MLAALKTESPERGTASAPRVLIAGVGYSHLRDYSIGPLLTAELKKTTWPDGVEIEDLSYGPIGVLHSLDERPRYDKMIFVTAANRQRAAGGVYRYQWDHQLPQADEIQARVAEAVTGVISLENLLIIATYFKKLADDVVVIEVEPADEGWGEGLTPQVEAALPAVIEKIHQEVNGA